MLLVAGFTSLNAMPENAEYGPAAYAHDRRYALAGGVFRYSSDGGRTYRTPEGLPVRVLPADRAGEPLPVTAVAVDPADGARLLLAVGHRLFVSIDGGAAWSEIDLSEALNPATYITAAAIDPGRPDHWALGTSYDGLYLTSDGGRTWEDVGEEWTVDPLYLGAGFYEEIAGLSFEQDGTLLVAAGLGGGFVTVSPSRRTAARLRPVEGEAAYRAPAIFGGADGRVPGVYQNIAGQAAYQTVAGLESGAGGIAGFGSPRNATGNLGGLAVGTFEAGQELDACSEGTGRRNLADGHTGIYVAAPNATAGKLPGYFDLIERHEFDSIVVDFKDDFGRVTYDTALDLPRAVGAVDPFVDVGELMRLADERGIYVIARIVVFKDRRLYRYDGYRYAIWDSERDAPWGVFRTITDEESGESRVVQVEHWVDPFAAEVWDYNLTIAEEVVSLGADEVQFDYIRFPSDGNTEAVVSRYAPDGAGRVEALEAFLSAARSRLTVPIGIDVFGFNAWSRMSYLGQDISRLGRYVDVISPMFYPSHFARSFLPRLSYFERSRVIYEEGTRRAREIADGPLIRPYVQAFLIGPELEYQQPEYFRYLDLQVEGVSLGGADGYTLWNASGRYYMLP